MRNRNDLAAELAQETRILKSMKDDPNSYRGRDERKRVEKAMGISFDQVRQSVCAALRLKFPPDADDPFCSGPWVEDIYDDVAIYSNEGKLFSTGYTFDSGEATLTGEPIEVIRSYAPANQPPPLVPGETPATAAPPAGEAAAPPPAA